MSKGFKIALLVFSIIGILFIDHLISGHCAKNYFSFSAPTCEDRFMCKVKVIKTQAELEREMGEKNILGISGPHAITECIPIYAR